ncbi:TPA: hypothetical protein ACH3X2_007417 [Trebouxia sp. C0005]
MSYLTVGPHSRILLVLRDEPSRQPTLALQNTSFCAKHVLLLAPSMRAFPGTTSKNVQGLWELVTAVAVVCSSKPKSSGNNSSSKTNPVHNHDSSSKKMSHPYT